MAHSHPLGPFVRRFLLEELLERNLSRNTRKSYRDTFRLLFRFLSEHYRTDPTRVTVQQVSADVVRHFLRWLQQERHNSVATQNQRLVALHSLFLFIARRVPELIEHATQVQRVPLRRVAPPTMSYLEKPEIDALLAVPDRLRPQGQRDHALLLLLYNTGARATEVAQLTLGALHLDPPLPFSRFVGKRRKIRLCPLWPHTVEVLRKLLAPRLQPRPEPDARVFLNVRGQPLTRFGIHSLLDRTVAKAAQTMPSLRDKGISPHTLRHTTAVHLLRAGVDINTIRAWLGHVSLETTNRYAEVDLEMKAKALQTCAVIESDPNVDPTPSWRKDEDLMAFLTSL
jgi:site-specific recombinase XerD